MKAGGLKEVIETFLQLVLPQHTEVALSECFQ